MSEQEWSTGGTLSRAGSSIQYWLSGPSDAPLVALTHGASMDHRMFESQVSSLVASGYRVLTWDVRGHGESKPLGEMFTVPAVARDLLALIDRLGDETAALVGQSFGGYVSQELAFRHSDRVSALAVIGATDITTPPSLPERVGLSLSPSLLRFWPDSHLRAQMARQTAVTPDAQQYAREATRKLSKRELLTVWTAVADCLHEEPDYRVRCPLLIAHGEHDRVGIITRTSSAWAEREECPYEVIPEAGHNANQDNPAATNRMLRSFLGEHVPP